MATFRGIMKSVGLDLEAAGVVTITTGAIVAAGECSFYRSREPSIDVAGQARLR